MHIEKAEFEQLGTFSSTFIDFIKGDEKLKRFYGADFTIENLKAATENRTLSKEIRADLHATLLSQYEGISHPPIENIDKLLDENTYTVTTGHQLNLFTGPLYFIYKIVAAINMSEQLNKAYPSLHFVPIYWAATEDHDFDEINHFRLFGKTYAWEKDDVSGAVGRLPIDGIKPILNDLDDTLPDFIKEAFRTSTTLTEATRQVVNHLFGKDGLVMLDADDKALKKHFLPTALDDIKHNTAHTLVNATNIKLTDAGYKPQIHAREINLFSLKDKSRERLIVENGMATDTASSFKLPLEEFIDHAKKNPEELSPNVVLRPLYQETILPNIAYIGGPAEMAYWLQLKDVFTHYNLPFPILAPRCFALVVKQQLRNKLDKLGISPKDLFQSEAALKNKIVEEGSEGDYSLNDDLTAIKAAFDHISSLTNEVDPSLEGFVRAEEKKTLKSIGNIEKRIQKAQEKKMEVSINQLMNIKGKLFPDGRLQERTDNFLSFYINDTEFIDKVKSSLDPFSLSFHILTSE